MSKKLVSIVIPCYNEEKNIDRTFDALLDFVKGHNHAFEFIAVNDGSKDNTWDVIKKYASQYPEVIGINQMRNYGQSAAYQAGFDVAKGDYVVILSADLETPISYINTVIKFLDEGYDLVNSNRVGRWGSEKASRKMKSGLANKLIAKVSGVQINDRGSGLKGFRKSALENLRLYGEMHRFIPDYMSVYGAKIKEFEVEFKDRDYGESYYKGSSRTVKVLLDLLTLNFMIHFANKPFSMMPGRLFGFSGFVMAFFGGLAGFYLIILKLMGESIGGRPLLIAAVVLFIVGFQSMMTGLLGELMLRVYFESTGRKTYTVREIAR